MTDWSDIPSAFGLPEETGPIFERFYQLLLEQNQTVNLTRLTAEAEFIVKHVLDSFSLLPFLKISNFSLIDVGTGGGFPGILLWIARPQMSFTLLDATAKKIRAVETMCQHLQQEFPGYLLTQPTCLAARAEEAGRQGRLREAFDVAVSRAVAPLPVLVEICLPFVRPGGLFIAMKGRNYHPELPPARKAAQVLGGLFVAAEMYPLPGDIEHTLIIFDKTTLTPGQYPRLPGVPAKKPLYHRTRIQE